MNAFYGRPIVFEKDLTIFSWYRRYFNYTNNVEINEIEPDIPFIAVDYCSTLLIAYIFLQEQNFL
jgi:hypothetical protein